MTKLISTRRPAILVFETGVIFHGESIGKIGFTTGEIIFNTSMSGYQEILTDPSYAGQIINFTYPHIGNVGTNLVDNESNKVWANGIIVRSFSDYHSNWRAEESLESFLIRHNIVGISEIDTRALTRIIQSQGSIKGHIISSSKLIDEYTNNPLSFSFNNKENLVEKVSTKVSLSYSNSPNNSHHIVVYDFGVKNSILNAFETLGCNITIVPFNTKVEEILKLKPDGVLLSNGPGDPEDCKEALITTQGLLEQEIPILGICLGHQLLALACGARTYKMKYGHHGANHPVVDIETQKVFITSQNHSYAVDEMSLPSCLKITYRSLFDSTIQGIKHISKPAFGFQGHPEASPGPHDISSIFQQFLELIQMEKYKFDYKKRA